jgi:homoserine dehydrogenase
MSRAPLRVAVLGAGTVGREVIARLLEPDRLCAADGAPVVLAGVATRDLAKARKAGVPADLLTDAPAHLVAAPDTDVVVELMGGDEPARTLIAAALGAGKRVVTANKHVLAHHGPDLEAVARRSGAPLRFEAAVGGGIPILSPLARDLAANEIRRVTGIVNGTTNFILSAMAADGRDYADVLADAQARGYAEADPAGDVEGDDAVNKLVILARLAFGAWLTPMSVGRRSPSIRGFGRPGITGVTKGQIAAAAAMGLAIKLIASATVSPSGVVAAVIPTAVPADGDLGRTSGVTNRINVDAEPAGTVSFAGPGAGGAATSSAVLGDIVAVARGGTSTWEGLPPAGDRSLGAADLTAERPAWFAFIPEASIREEHGVPDLPDVETRRTDGGLAVRTGRMALDDVRPMLAPLLCDAVDVPLYPIDA